MHASSSTRSTDLVVSPYEQFRAARSATRGAKASPRRSSASWGSACARFWAWSGRHPCRRSMVRSARIDVGTGRARRSRT